MTLQRYLIQDMAVVVDQDDIVRRLEQGRQDDWAGEETMQLLSFLDYAHAKPYLKDEVTASEWGQGDQEPQERQAIDNARLRELLAHYRDWWAQKVRDGRGISVHRGRSFMVNLLFLAGVEGWEVLRDMDGGWYQEDAYNWTADIFGWSHVRGERH